MSRYAIENVTWPDNDRGPFLFHVATGGKDGPMEECPVVPAAAYADLLAVAERMATAIGAEITDGHWTCSVPFDGGTGLLAAVAKFNGEEPNE